MRQHIHEIFLLLLDFPSHKFANSLQQFPFKKLSYPQIFMQIFTERCPVVLLHPRPAFALNYDTDRSGAGGWNKAAFRFNFSLKEEFYHPERPTSAARACGLAMNLEAAPLIVSNR